MPRSIFLIAIAVFAVAAGCGPEQSELPIRHLALGEPFGSYPSLEERVGLYLTNRARTEPDAFNPEGDYSPSPPLRFDLELAHAARFHARHIVEASCWCEDHSSCCPLSGTGEDVACGGPVTGCGAESPDARVARFASGYTGENMASGQRSAAEAMESWTFSAGHWQNINNPASTRLGFGNHETAWVQDFGGGGQPLVIGDGVHFRAGQSTTFGITYYQPGTGGPRTALVIVDGECHDLDLAYGAADHGAFETTLSLGRGCHRYTFHFTDGEGRDWTYPDFGSFAVAVDDPTCEFFVDTRPADTCSPSGQTCMTGDTRHCYTGPFGTEGVGTCEPGVERCVAGQWAGECRLEVLPTETDLCGDGADDDCDGQIDEGCSAVEDVGTSDVESPAVSAPDARDSPPVKSKPDEPPGGCATAGATPAAAAWPPLVFLCYVLRRRRERMERS